MRRSLGRLADALRRAREYAGPERETLFLLFKSGLAGVVAWVLAKYAIASPQPTYAPFTALLVVQSTAYRTLMQTLRYVLAVVIGVVAAGVAGPFVGQNAWGFAAMLAAALVIGRWQRLGSQGMQVAVAAVFAFNALSSTPTATLWQIISMAVLGAAVGVAVALAVLPPLRYRTARRGVTSMSDALESLLDDMAAGLRSGMPERDTVVDWLERARQLDRTAQSARQAVDSGAESVVWNPRRLLRRRPTPTTFRGYRTLVESLSRAGEQLRSICYALLRILDDEHTEAPAARFLTGYAELLETLALAPVHVGAHPGEPDEENPVKGVLDSARDQHEDLTDGAGDDSSGHWATYGVLLTDADRLVDEFSYAHANGALHPEAEREAEGEGASGRRR